MSLEKELETYKAKLPSLCESEGKWVLIHGTEIKGIFAAYEDALAEGYKAFGLNPFLVKQIETEGQVHFFTRDLVLACPTLH